MRILIVVGAMAILCGLLALRPGDRNERIVCRVVVGTKPSIEFLAGFQGEELLIYRDGSMDSEPERYPMKDGQLKNGDTIPPFKYGEAFFQINACYKYEEIKPLPRTSMMLHGTIRDPDISFKQYCDVTMVPVAKELKLAHFDGPLKVAIQKYDWKPIPIEFVIDGKPTDIRVNIDTSDKDAGCWTTVESGANKVCNFETGIRPVATIEFPSGDPNQPIVKKYDLDQFC